jgi:hypothetical protein
MRRFRCNGPTRVPNRTGDGSTKKKIRPKNQKPKRNAAPEPRLPFPPIDSCVLDCTGEDIFVVVNGARIARRGYPGTPQAKTWVSLEPGWKVLDGPGGKTIAIEYNGTRVQ